LKKLEHCGINFSAVRKVQVEREVVGTFSLTGIFPFDRGEIKELLEKNGYLFHEAPTRQTDFLLVGEKAGGKRLKAEQYGIPLYEGREAIKQHLPIVEELEKAVAQKLPKASSTTQESLF
jgi:NAD-dependent DNA ligase